MLSSVPDDYFVSTERHIPSEKLNLLAFDCEFIYATSDAPQLNPIVVSIGWFHAYINERGHLENATYWQGLVDGIGNTSEGSGAYPPFCMHPDKYNLKRKYTGLPESSTELQMKFKREGWKSLAQIQEDLYSRTNASTIWVGHQLNGDVNALQLRRWHRIIDTSMGPFRFKNKALPLTILVRGYLYTPSTSEYGAPDIELAGDLAGLDVATRGLDGLEPINPLNVLHKFQGGFGPDTGSFHPPVSDAIAPVCVVFAHILGRRPEIKEYDMRRDPINITHRLLLTRHHMSYLNRTYRVRYIISNDKISIVALAMELLPELRNYLERCGKAIWGSFPVFELDDKTLSKKPADDAGVATQPTTAKALNTSTDFLDRLVEAEHLDKERELGHIDGCPSFMKTNGRRETNYEYQACDETGWIAVPHDDFY